MHKQRGLGLGLDKPTTPKSQSNNWLPKTTATTATTSTTSTTTTSSSSVPVKIMEKWQKDMSLEQKKDLCRIKFGAASIEDIDIEKFMEGTAILNDGFNSTSTVLERLWRGGDQTPTYPATIQKHTTKTGGKCNYTDKILTPLLDKKMAVKHVLMEVVGRASVLSDLVTSSSAAVRNRDNQTALRTTTSSTLRGASSSFSKGVSFTTKRVSFNRTPSSLRMNSSTSTFKI
jgi:hypothetical protein